MKSGSTGPPSSAPYGTTPTRPARSPASGTRRQGWRKPSMALDPRRYFPVMCLTQDGIGIAHAEQAARLCAAGARWIQLRMKGATRAAWLAEAAAAAAACRRPGAVLVVNDSVEIALESGADGAHLGGLDADWREARQRLRPRRGPGGTGGGRGGGPRGGG